jgi:transposase
VTEDDVAAGPVVQPGDAGDGVAPPSYAQLVALVQQQAVAIAALTERVAVLEAENADLRRRLGRNSGNSSMPPSADDAVPGRPSPARRSGGSRGGKRGKQRGAPGSGLAWSIPDETIEHYPTGACGGCGADLATAADEGVAGSDQVHDVPLSTRTITQHDRHRVRCGCGVAHLAPRPAEVAATTGAAGDRSVSYGPNLRALVVYLVVHQHVPIERAALLVADLTGATPSTGFIHAMLKRAASAVTDTVALIKTLITAAHVAGFDETTLRAGPAGTRMHVLSASTTESSGCINAVVYWLGRRNLTSFKDFGVLPGFTGIAVHDRYTLYDHPNLVGSIDGNTPIGGHQLCCAHLLRDLADAGETYPTANWPAQTSRALRGLIHAANTARDKGLTAVPDDETATLLREFRHGVLVGLAEIRRQHATDRPAASTKQDPGRLLLECLRDREADVLRFITDTRIWPTNNTSERDLRPLKTQQKISGRLQSETVTRDRLTIRSYVTTATRNGAGALTALRDALTGNPWTPRSSPA